MIYWDKVTSIVSYDSYPGFSPEVLYLRENELFEPIFPKDLFFSEYALEFADAIVSVLITTSRMRLYRYYKVFQK